MDQSFQTHSEGASFWMIFLRHPEGQVESVSV